MRIVLNSFTDTVHKPSHEGSQHPAACGALRHVSADHVRTLTTDDLEGRSRTSRCGRCFENGGGY